MSLVKLTSSYLLHYISIVQLLVSKEYFLKLYIYWFCMLSYNETIPRENNENFLIINNMIRILLECSWYFYFNPEINFKLCNLSLTFLWICFLKLCGKCDILEILFSQRIMEIKLHSYYQNMYNYFSNISLIAVLLWNTLHLL